MQVVLSCDLQARRLRMPIRALTCRCAQAPACADARIRRTMRRKRRPNVYSARATMTLRRWCRRHGWPPMQPIESQSRCSSKLNAATDACQVDSSRAVAACRRSRCI